MQGKMESTGRLSSQSPDKQRPVSIEERVGVRSCLELILKLIIALIAIALFAANWYREKELNLFTLILLLFLVALLIWLILRQRHFVCLKCDLTKPTDCIHGDTALLAGYVLEPIVGTATGFGFSHYELELLWNGVTGIPDAVVYADLAGNPDTALATGNHQVNNGTLGFVDLQQAALGAGVDLLTSTSFEVRLHVVGIGHSRQTCTTAFSVSAARAYIKYIGGAWAHEVTVTDEPLRVVDDGVSALATVGGSISVRGAANVYGCALEKIAEYHVWAIPDPTFTFAQPVNNSAIVPGADWLAVATVVYADDGQRNYNMLDGMPDPDFLTNVGWFTRQVCVWFDWLDPFCMNVPDLHEFWWPSGASGKYTFLLQVIDTAGNTYYDIQRAWIDNETIRGKIQGPAGVGPCADIFMLDVPGGVIAIEGYATDPLIVPGDLTQPTSDNFKEYRVGFRKQGAAADEWLDIPLAAGSYPALSPTLPVPDRATWSGGVGDPPASVLAEWDLRWLDAATNPHGLPADQLLAEGESCSYDIVLKVWDKTIVNEHHNHWTGRLTFPIKIHNAHAP